MSTLVETLKPLSLEVPSIKFYWKKFKKVKKIILLGELISIMKIMSAFLKSGRKVWNLSLSVFVIKMLVNHLNIS